MATIKDKRALVRHLKRVARADANKAIDLITGDRAIEYGLYTANFARIAAKWGCTSAEAALKMAQLKIARIESTPYNAHTDSFIDAIAYLMLAHAMHALKLNEKGVYNDDE